MADYLVELGVKLNTKNIDAQINSYKNKEIKLKAGLDTSDISTALSSYKAKPIVINSTLNTDGITDKIKKYDPRKMIHLKSKLSMDNVEKTISCYQAKPIKLGAELYSGALNKAIKEQAGSVTEAITVKAKLDDNAINKAISNWSSETAVIPIKVKPNFDEVNFNKVEELLENYTARTPLKVNAQLNKTAINNEISRFNTELKGERNSDILLQVKITDTAVSDAVSKYKSSDADKLKIPVDLTIKPNTEFDSKLKAKIAEYEKAPVSIPAKLIPYDKGFSSQIQKVPVPITATLTNAADINKEIQAYTGKEVPIKAKLIPAHNFADNISKKVVPIYGKLNTEGINAAIDAFVPSSKMKIGVDLQDNDVNAQIDAIKATSKVKVLLDLDDNVSFNNDGINTKAPHVNVKLNFADINKQIKEFKPSSKITVGIKLDFASHKGGQVGIPQQIKNYKTNTRIKVGAELQTNDINSQIEQIHPTSKIKVLLDIDDNVDQNKLNEVVQSSVKVKLDKDEINKQVREFNRESKVKVPMDLQLFGNGGKNSISQQVRVAIRQAFQGLTARPIPIQVQLEQNSVQRVRNQINNIRQQIAALGNIRINFGGNNRNNTIGATTSGFQRALREVYNLYKQIESIELKLGNLNMSGLDSGNIAQYRVQLDQLRTTYQTLLATLNGQNGVVDLDLVFIDIDQARTSVANLTSTIDNARTRLSKDIKINISNGNLQSEIGAIEQRFSQLGVRSQQVTNNISELQRLLSNMDASDDVESITNDYRDFSQILKTVKNDVADLQAIVKNLNATEAFDLKKEAAMSKLNLMFEDGSRAAKVFGGRAKQLAIELDNCGNANIDNVIKKINILGQEVKNSNLQTKTLSSSLKEQFQRYSSYLSVASVFMYATQAARSMFEQVKLIDSAMTELKKVTNETDASYDKFLTNAASRAKEIGTTIDGLVSSTADFARLGYGFEDSQKLAEVANIYAVVGDEIEGVEDATQSLVSTIAAFKDEMNDMDNSEFAMSIVDKMNEVSNNFSISSGGIGEALQRSASSMAAANNSLDETIAMITASNEVTQNPEKVGNAMKTMSMRIRGAKTELEEAGESTDGMAESTASLRQEMLALSGVDIMLNDTTFKSTYQIMDELSKKWENLSDIAQATIIELVAGKHQGNVFASLMANFDTARKALDTSINSSGSAMEEHAKWSESIEARLNKLKAAWQSLSQTFMDSKFLKVGLDFITGFIEVLDKIIDKVGILPLLFSALAGKNAIGKILNTSKTMQFAGGISRVNDVISILANSFPTLTKAITLFIGKLVESKNVLSAFGAAAGAFNPVALGVTALVATVGIGVAAYNKYTESAEELAERIEEVTTKYKEQREELEKIKGDYDTSDEDSLISRYGELSKGVNTLGENISLTVDEYSEYQNIISTIAEQMPNLVTGYNSQGDAILDCAGDVDKLADSYKNLIKEQNNKVLKNGSDIFDDFKNNLKESHAYFKESVDTDEDGYTNYFKEYFNTDHIDSLENLITLKEDYNKSLEEKISELSFDEVTRISSLLNDYGIERNLLGTGDAGWESEREHIIRALSEDKKKVKSILEEASADLNVYAEELGTVTEAYFSTAFLGGDESAGIVDYSNLSKRIQNIISQVTSGFDSEFYTQFLDDENPYESLTTYLDSMLNSFNNLGSGDKVKLEAAFDLQTEFNGGDISYGEYVKGLKDVESLINGITGLDGKAKSQVKLALNTDEVVRDYEKLTKRLTSDIFAKDILKLGHFSGINVAMEDATNKAKEFLNGLTASEYAIAIDLIANKEIDLTNFSIDSFRKYIEEQAKLNDAMSFTIPISAELEWKESLKTALEESASAAGLTSESIELLTNRYKDLEEFDAEKLFMNTVHGIKVNTDAVSELESALENQTKAQKDLHLDTLEKEYYRLTEEIEKAGTTAERADFYAQRDEIVNQMEDISSLASQYEGLTSAYNDWLHAQDVADKGDSYSQAMTMMEGAVELKKSGHVGTNEFKTSAQFVTYDDLSNADIDTIVNKWVSGKKKFDKYFTEDESGSVKFLNDLNSINEEWAKFENDEWDVNVDIEEAAKEMEVSTSFIMTMLDEIEARGIKINYDDNSLDEFKTHAEEAAEYLEKITGEKLDPKIGTGNIKTVNEELDRFKLLYDTIVTQDGTVNIDADGAEEAREIVLALIKEKQQLEKPAIMEIKVDGDSAETDVGKATQAVKDLQDNLWKLEQSTYDPEINSSEVQAEISEIIGDLNKLENSSPEIYTKLGLDKTQIDNIKTAIGNIQTSINTDVEPKQEDIDTLKSTIGSIDATVVANVLTEELNSTTGTAVITPKPLTSDLGDDFFGNATITPNPFTLDLGNEFFGEATITPKPLTSDLGDDFFGSAKIKLTTSPTSLNVTVTGVSKANGTAFANGTTGKAFKKGDWSIKDSGIALGGELGQELVVRDGRYFTIGDKGAEFFNYKSGDIIFNAGQTKQLFEQGKITNGRTRGMALATGTVKSTGRAFAYTGDGNGSLYGNSEDESVVVKANKVTIEGDSVASGSSDSGSSTKTTKEEKEFKETIDWIEIAIDRIERAIDRLDTKANSVYRTWSERNSALADEITKVKDEIDLQEKAYTRYIEEASKVGLSSSWAEKVRNGEVDISTITDEDLADKISEYQTW